MTARAPQSRGSAFGKENLPERALVTGDIRALSKDQFADAEGHDVNRGGIVCRTKAEITFEEGYPPMAPTDGNRRLLALYDQASRDIGAGQSAVGPDRGEVPPTFRSSRARCR
jgi:glutamate carboxypeptidase